MSNRSTPPIDDVRLDRTVARWITAYLRGDEDRRRALVVAAVEGWNTCIARERSRASRDAPGDSISADGRGEQD